MASGAERLLHFGSILTRDSAEWDRTSATGAFRLADGCSRGKLALTSPAWVGLSEVLAVTRAAKRLLEPNVPRLTKVNYVPTGAS